jgi:hypothetical protein
MAGAGVALAKKLGTVVLGELIAWGAVKILNNKIDGKTWNGKEKIEKRKDDTYVDWHGNIILGTADGRVE